MVASQYIDPWSLITNKTEVWITQGGHLLMGSGYELPTQEVALLVHKKLKLYVKKFYSLNERIAYVFFFSHSHLLPGRYAQVREGLRWVAPKARLGVSCSVH